MWIQIEAEICGGSSIRSKDETKNPVFGGIEISSQSSPPSSLAIAILRSYPFGVIPFLSTSPVIRLPDSIMEIIELSLKTDIFHDTACVINLFVFFVSSK